MGLTSIVSANTSAVPEGEVAEALEVVYYMQTVEEQAKFARQLHERIRREFPEVRMPKRMRCM